MVTNYQIKKVEYRNNKGIKNCNRRLKILYHELHCIDRFFPPVNTGSARQHLMLDKVGAKVLNLNKFYKLNKPVLQYRHHILVSEFDIRAYHAGLGWAKLEYRLGNQIADLYYPKRKIAVEVDTGSESHKTLKSKIEGYNRLFDLNYLVFITIGGTNRINIWNENIKKDIKFIGSNFKDLDQLLAKYFA